MPVSWKGSMHIAVNIMLDDMAKSIELWKRATWVCTYVFAGNGREGATRTVVPIERVVLKLEGPGKARQGTDWHSTARVHAPKST